MTSTSPTGAEREPLIPLLGLATTVFVVIGGFSLLGAGAEALESAPDWELAGTRAAVGSAGLIAGGLLELLRRVLKS